MPRCADPVLCYNDGDARRFRHFSLANPIFKILSNEVFDCGKCVFCRKKRAMELAVRCVLHASLYDHNCFLTLTYDEERPSYHNRFEYKDVQDFKKRLRSWVWYHYRDRVDVFNVHEYGKNGKKHWHLVVFNFDFEDKVFHTSRNGHALYRSEDLSSLWGFGFGAIGNVTEASAMYQAQYTQKDLKNGNLFNEKKSHSKHSGIGRDYFLKHFDQILSLGFIPFSGRKIPIPRYFQKIAHKHYSHFFEPINFVDTPDRKRLYTPFKDQEPNRRMADLYIEFVLRRRDWLRNITEEWDAFIADHAFDKEKPDFLVAAENRVYDLEKRFKQSEF